MLEITQDQIDVICGGGRHGETRLFLPGCRNKPIIVMLVLSSDEVFVSAAVYVNELRALQDQQTRISAVRTFQCQSSLIRESWEIPQNRASKETTESLARFCSEDLTRKKSRTPNMFRKVSRHMKYSENIRKVGAFP